MVRFAFESLASLLDFAVFALDLGVLLDKLSRFFFELLVSLLQFFLPALQFSRERLRLFQQIPA